MTLEEELVLDLMDEIQKELNRDIVSHLKNGTPLESTPMVFENDEQRDAFSKALREHHEYLKEKKKSAGH